MKWILTVFVLAASIHGYAQRLNMELKNLDSEWINLSDQTGEQLTVIDFWATWCKPCVNALPKINQLSQEFSGQQVSFIGINVDGPRNMAKVNPFVNALQLHYTILLDPDKELMNEFNASVLPTLLVLNKNGMEVYRHEGFQPGDEDTIADKITQLLSYEQ